MRVHVELPEELDVADHARRHARGEIPDRTPYGLHHINAAGVEVTFRRPAGGLLAYGARKVRDRLRGHEAVTAVTGAVQRRGADVLLCMDERTGVPAALSSSRPVVTGIGWLERPEVLEPARRRLTTIALRRSAAVYSQCEGMIPLLRESWGLEPQRVHHVTLGIDPDFFPLQPWDERDPGEVTITSVGDDRHRDHATLVGAVERVRAGGIPAWLELATTLPVELAPEVGVVHARRMNAAMRGLYRRSSIVAVALHPAPTGSGLTVVLEAMASGRPVVATDNPGIGAYVDQGRTGILVPPGDPEAMADAIASLLADPDRARAMGEAGRKDVESRFTTAAMADELRALARSVV